MNISKDLLIHSATSKKIAGMNADRMPVYSAEQTLTNVFVNLEKSVTNGTVGNESSDNGTMFFDCVHSTPSNYVPQMGETVVFDSKEYTINSIKKCYGLKGLEHYEIGLK